eukprot:3056959-Pleurochrysis_carterae.AAC.1
MTGSHEPAQGRAHRTFLRAQEDQRAARSEKAAKSTQRRHARWPIERPQTGSPFADLEAARAYF